MLFFFTGTGNSLWVSKEITKKWENCEIISMSKQNAFKFKDNYNSIGFFYPIYG